MVNYKKWSDKALFDEWWHLVSRHLSSAIYDKIALSEHFGLRVLGYGETPDLPISLEPMNFNSAFENYRLIEEVFTRISKFPMYDTGNYIGRKNPDVDDRAYVQWSLMAMYNMGFQAALDSIKELEDYEKKKQISGTIE